MQGYAGVLCRIVEENHSSLTFEPLTRKRGVIGLERILVKGKNKGKHPKVQESPQISPEACEFELGSGGAECIKSLHP